MKQKLHELQLALYFMSFERISSCRFSDLFPVHKRLYSVADGFFKINRQALVI